jgi:hypothetical protein
VILEQLVQQEVLVQRVILELLEPQGQQEVLEELEVLGTPGQLEQLVQQVTLAQ